MAEVTFPGSDTAKGANGPSIDMAGPQAYAR